MKPDDETGKRPTAKRPFRVLVIAGSNRWQHNCPGVDSKARASPSNWYAPTSNLKQMLDRLMHEPATRGRSSSKRHRRHPRA
jgi:hypothetical protein